MASVGCGFPADSWSRLVVKSRCRFQAFRPKAVYSSAIELGLAFHLKTSPKAKEDIILGQKMYHRPKDGLVAKP